jgi:hypothetical protein
MKSRLTGLEQRELENALASAFPSHIHIARLVRHYLNINLNSIALGSSLQEIIFNLVEWAISQGKIEEIIRCSKLDNPGNPELNRFNEKYERIIHTEDEVDPRFVFTVTEMDHLIAEYARLRQLERDQILTPKSERIDFERSIEIYVRLRKLEVNNA